MIFKSKYVALVIGVFVSTLTIGSLLFIDESEALVFFIVFLGSFVSSYSITYLILEFIIFKELRKFYSHVSEIGGTNATALQADDLNLSKMSTELFRYTSKKDEEIQKLKKVEAFRREFLADISHELKTPIFTAQGFLLTLLEGAMDDEKVRMRFLKKAAKSLDSLDNLVKDLVAISQLETGEFKLKKELFNIVDLVNEEVEQFDHKAKEQKIELSLEASDPFIIVQADYYRLAQVFQNLISNAIKYSGGNCKVIVFIQHDDGVVHINVKDTGTGIPSEHIDKLFQRFYRVDKSRSRQKGGSGLGLSIVRSIIEAHGSEINVKSTLDKGTEFMFSLSVKEAYDDSYVDDDTQ